MRWKNKMCEYFLVVLIWINIHSHLKLAHTKWEREREEREIKEIVSECDRKEREKYKDNVSENEIKETERIYVYHDESKEIYFSICTTAVGCNRQINHLKIWKSHIKYDSLHKVFFIHTTYKLSHMFRI